MSELKKFWFYLFVLTKFWTRVKKGSFASNIAVFYE